MPPRKRALTSLHSLPPLALLALPLLAAACGPPWVIVRQSVPTPYIGRPLTAEPLRFDGLVVGDKPEPVYQAEKDPVQRQSWQTDKAESAAAFMGELLLAAADLNVRPPPGQPGGFVIRVNIIYFEPGFYVGVAARASEMRMVLQIVDPNGAVVDEIQSQVNVGADLTNPSSGGRMRAAGAALGRVAAYYLRHRIRGRAEGH